MFLFKVGQLTLVFVIMFFGANVRVLGFLHDLQGWALSGSPQSMLCTVGRRCGCRQGSSRGNPNGSSSPATWDLLYEAAGEVERMRMNNEEGCCFNNQSRGPSGPPRKPPPISIPSKNPISDVSLYQQQSLAYQKLQASQVICQAVPYCTFTYFFLKIEERLLLLLITN
jgi:hypothetical protein